MPLNAEARQLIDLIKDAKIDETSRIRQFDDLICSFGINNYIDYQTNSNAVMVAAKYNRAALIKHIYDPKGKYKDSAELDARDQNGDTSLHHAVRLYHYQAVKELCKADASPSMWNNAYCTPLDYAIQNRQIKIISVLLHHGAFANQTNLLKIWDIIKSKDPVKFGKYIRRSINAIAKDYPSEAIAMVDFLNAHYVKEEPAKAPSIQIVDQPVKKLAPLKMDEAKTTIPTLLKPLDAKTKDSAPSTSATKATTAPLKSPTLNIAVINTQGKPPLPPKKLATTSAFLLNALNAPVHKLKKLPDAEVKAAPKDLVKLVQPLIEDLNQQLPTIIEVPTPAPTPPTQSERARSAPTSPGLYAAPTVEQLQTWALLFNADRYKSNQSIINQHSIPNFVLAQS